MKQTDCDRDHLLWPHLGHGHCQVSSSSPAKSIKGNPFPSQNEKVGIMSKICSTETGPRRLCNIAHPFVLLLTVTLLAVNRPACADGEMVEQIRPNFGRYFSEAGTEGTIVISALRQGVSIVYNPERADHPYLPSSTFKIPNSLIALETGVVKDVDQGRFAWNGRPFLVDGKPLLSDACNADITLRTALQNSCVPVYQEIARQVGLARYQSFLHALSYGNEDAGGAAIDWFWLSGNLRITARQQVDFLTRFYRSDLPFSARSMAQVKDIMLVEQTPTYVIRAKTGFVFATKPAVGWWVGWVETKEDVYVFALNLDLLRPDQSKARMLIVKAVLHDLGAI